MRLKAQSMSQFRFNWVLLSPTTYLDHTDQSLEYQPNCSEGTKIGNSLVVYKCGMHGMKPPFYGPVDAISSERKNILTVRKVSSFEVLHAK